MSGFESDCSASRVVSSDLSTRDSLEEDRPSLCAFEQEIGHLGRQIQVQVKASQPLSFLFLSLLFPSLGAALD